MKVYVVLRKVADAPSTEPDARPYTEVVHVSNSLGEVHDFIELYAHDWESGAIYDCTLYEDARHNGGLRTWHTGDDEYWVELHNVSYDPVFEVGCDTLSDENA